MMNRMLKKSKKKKKAVACGMEENFYTQPEKRDFKYNSGTSERERGNRRQQSPAVV